MNYQIILSDGSTIDNLSMNGNNFVSATELTEVDFEDKLSPVTIIHPNGYQEIHDHMELVQIVNDWYTEGNWYFVLTDIPESELRYANIMSNIDYISMMTDVDMSQDGDIAPVGIHGRYFDRVRTYYKRKLWGISRVRDAVDKQWITPEEFTEITDQQY